MLFDPAGWALLLAAYVAVLWTLLRPPGWRPRMDADTFRWAVVVALACICFLLALIASRR